MSILEPELAAIVSVGSKFDAPGTSPYARPKAFADGKADSVSPENVRELITAFNGTNAMLGVRNLSGDHQKRVSPP